MPKPLHIHQHLLVIAGTVLLGACSDATAPPNLPPPHAAHLLVEIVGAPSFEGTVGATISPGPAIRVLRDSVARTPVPGVNVVFTLHPALCFLQQWCPQLQLGVVPTDASGIASLGALPLDTIVGSYMIMAQPEEAPSLSWSVTILPGPVAKLAIISGTGQRSRPGTSLPGLLRVRAVDAYNNPVAEGTPVTFSVTAGGGSITNEAVATDALGIASPGRWTLGSAGPQEVTARSGGLEAVFTASLCAADEPCVSLTQLAFVRGNNVFLSDGTGSDPLLLSSDASRPSWSPDGARFAFARGSSDGTAQICIAEADGFAPRCTVDKLAGTVETRPAWSPDGGKLIFSTFACAGACVFTTYQLNTATMGTAIVPGRPLLSVSWSPDGGKIAFVTFESGIGAMLGTMNADGSGAEILKDRFGSYVPARVAWSADGEKLALLLWNENACPWDCYMAVGVTDVRATELTLLQNTEEYEWLDDVTWSPDGRITYARSYEREIVSVSPGGGMIELLLTNATSPSWRPMP